MPPETATCLKTINELVAGQRGRGGGGKKAGRQAFFSLCQTSTRGLARLRALAWPSLAPSHPWLGLECLHHTPCLFLLRSPVYTGSPLFGRQGYGGPLSGDKASFVLLSGDGDHHSLLNLCDIPSITFILEEKGPMGLMPVRNGECVFMSVVGVKETRERERECMCVCEWMSVCLPGRSEVRNYRL